MVEASPLIGRTSRVSATAFTGRATAPAQPDPITTGLINKNSLQLSVVSNQIQGMTAQMNSLAGSLQVISTNLATSQALDRQREQQEQALQSKLAQEKLREGKESVIEKKIQTAAIAPAQKLAGTAQFTLTRLNSFFMSLLGGWLLLKGVETIKALGDGNKDKLNEIKDNVIKNLTIIGGAYIGIRFGLRGLSQNFFRIGSRLLAVAAAGLFVNPVSQLIDYVVKSAKNAANSLTQSLPDPVKNVLGVNNAEEQNIDPSKPPEEQASTESLGTGGPSLATPTETMMGEKVNSELQELKNERAATRQEYFMNRIDKEEYQSKMEELDGKINNFKPEAQISAQPQETMLGKPAEEKGSEEIDASKPPEYGKASMSAESAPPVEGDESKQTQAGQLKEGSKSLVELAFSDEAKSFVDAEKYIGKFGKLPPDMFTPVKKDGDVAQKVGPAPEPPVNVVPIPAADESAKAPQQKPAATGSINKAPSFATSNADNIYTLGAYSNFNVLPV